MAKKDFMQTIKYIVSIAVVYFLSLNLTFAFTKEPDGFRDLKWGTDISSLKGMVKVNPDSYRKENENLFYYNTKVNDILYFFSQGKLKQVTLRIQNLNSDNEKLIEEALTKDYGNPEGPFCYDNECSFDWRGDKTQIIFSYSSVNREALITFRTGL